MTYVFDVCDTLFRSNTTYDFVRFVLDEHGEREKSRRLRRVLSPVPPAICLLVALSVVSGRDIAKERALRLLKGLSRSRLYELAEEFYADYLEARKIPETLGLLEKARMEGEQVILLSASIDPVISAIARKLGVSFGCTTLLYRDGIFEGEIAFEMRGRKLEVLRSEFAPRSDRLVVVTDNLADKRLLQSADERHAVVWSAKKKRKWSSLRPHFIEPGA